MEKPLDWAVCSVNARIVSLQSACLLPPAHQRHVRVFLPIIWHDLACGVQRAFADRGHDTLVFDWQRHQRALDREQLEARMIETARAFRPDLAFCQFQAPDVISEAFPLALREQNCFAVHWCGDVRAPLPAWYLRLAPYFAVTSFSNGPDCDAVRAAGCRSEFLQIGVDDRLYHPPHPESERSGVVFIGNNWLNFYPEGRNRIRTVQALAAALGGDFRVYGQGWSGLVPSRSYGGILRQPADAEVYRSARIAVGWEHFRRAGYASDRLLRATACGCTVVQRHYDGIDQDHPHVIAVETVEELVQATCAVLQQGDAGSGLNNAHGTLTNHTWLRRVKQIETWLS